MCRCGLFIRLVRGGFGGRGAIIFLPVLAEIAQLAEHAHGKRKVPGANPGLGSRRGLQINIFGLNYCYGSKIKTFGKFNCASMFGMQTKKLLYPQE